MIRPEIILESSEQSQRNSDPPSDSFLSRRKKAARAAVLERNQIRLERDIARGYSVNVKQVVLAFAVEFWIIGLIIAGTYLLVAENGHLTGEALFGALLFPAALAVVELARVPLAIATRTQNVWHIKFLAALGVLAAITVTSFSLSQIAWKTFDNRLADATQANDRLTEVKNKKAALRDKNDQWQRDVKDKIAARNNVNERLGALEAQLTKIGSSSVTTPKLVLGPDGKPLTDASGHAVTASNQKTDVSQIQLNALKGQIASTRKELEVAEAAVQQAYGQQKTFDPSQMDEELRKTEAEYRAAVNNSQLHTYTAMFTGKAVAEVTDSDVRNFEKYLIVIPSIAAALASTLIAITSVRRIKPREPQPVVAIPDEAANYLFGPLMAAIQKTARDAVTEAMSGNARATPPPETAKTS